MLMEKVSNNSYSTIITSCNHICHYISAPFNRDHRRGAGYRRRTFNLFIEPLKDSRIFTSGD